MTVADENPSTPPAGNKEKPKLGRPKGSKNGVSAARRDGTDIVSRSRRKSPWFGRKLKMLRSTKGLSQSALEKALLDRYGIRMPHLSLGRIERGMVTATTDEAWAICEFFEVPLRWMLNPANTDLSADNYVVAAKDYFRALQLIDQLGPQEAVNRMLKIERSAPTITVENASKITPPELGSEGRARDAG